MTTRKWPSFLLMAIAVLCFSSCQDWGQMDPPAGNQVYPKLEQIATYTFDEEPDPTLIQTFAHPKGELPTLEADEELGSTVLHLNGGYARIFNPLNNVKVQNGVSMTFFVKQTIQTDEETGKEADQDLEGAIISFQNSNGAQRMFMTANGWLRYEGVDGTYENNNPATTKTGMMSAGEWHYVAISVTNNGYFVYVDGMKKVEQHIADFDCSKIVQFMASVPHIYLGYGSDTQTKDLLIDDLKIYRNTITNKEWADPRVEVEEGSIWMENIFGATDFSTGFWSAFSPYLSADGDFLMHYEFTNYTKGTNNWENWVLVITNGGVRGEADYAEHLVLRADAFGWAGYYDAANMTHDYNWDTFAADMQGAKVVVEVKRKGTRIDMTAITTTQTGTTYTYTYTIPNAPTGTIGTFFTLEAAYLEFDVENTTLSSIHTVNDREVIHNVVYPFSTTGNRYQEGTKTTGNMNFSDGFWSVFTDFVAATETNAAINFRFYNHTKAVNNWENWVLVVTNGKDRDEEGYAEHFVLRADAFGWGSLYVGENITHTYNWDTFTTDINGALIDLTIKREGSYILMDAVTTTATGGTLNYTYYIDNLPSGPIGAFFTLEAACIDMLSIAKIPFNE